MVSIIYTYKNLPESDKAFLEKYLATKVDRLSTLVKSFAGAVCRLEVRAEKFATKSAYKIGMQLHLSGHQIIAEEDDHTVVEATDLALDKLIIQLRKLVDKKNKK
ncbi:MAG TPA: HPF/RaiA family ribosome-associated protein [Patescibacteria group bacterium]|nr:HPF/RaiA family ribosome-associated protein [Patescibacteria group bacterium]